LIIHLPRGLRRGLVPGKGEKAGPINVGARREWDSNPRYGCPYTRFPSVRLQPLGHPSSASLVMTAPERFFKSRTYKIGVM
jgi:hypothetical protein